MTGRGAATSVDLMSLAPVRRARWGLKGGGTGEDAGEHPLVVVERPLPRSRGLRRLLDRLSHALSMRYIRLDAVGSFAWRHLDGATTVAGVGERMRRAVKRGELAGQKAGDAADRVGTFVAQLHQLELVALPGVDGEEVIAAARADPGAAGPTLEFDETS